MHSNTSGLGEGGASGGGWGAAAYPPQRQSALRPGRVRGGRAGRAGHEESIQM